MQAVAIALPNAVEYFIYHLNQIACNDRKETAGNQNVPTIFESEAIDLERKKAVQIDGRLVV